MGKAQAGTIYTAHTGSALARALTLTYGVLVYLWFLGTFLYIIGFLGSFGVPKAINDGVVGSGAVGITINLLIMGLFAIQHTIMARPAFKAWWARWVPAPIEPPKSENPNLEIRDLDWPAARPLGTLSLCIRVHL